MAMDHNQGRRGHFHRGRRGPDRRGLERRGTPAEAVSRPERNDRVDVEQIMREIRGRISQRSGIDLSNQQIQELAARRLEAILDPRGLKPELLDQLRRSAGERTVSVDAAAPGGMMLRIVGPGWLRGMVDRSRCGPGFSALRVCDC